MYTCRKTLVICFGLFICLSSCGSREQDVASQQIEEPKQLEQVQEEHIRRNNTITQDSANFKLAFEHFLQALHSTDTVALNLYIHPDYGLWVIEQPGAVPKMTHVTDFRNFKREYQDRSFFTVREEVKTCDLQEEAWPTFDCADMNYDLGKSGYSKEGCFVAGPTKFQKSGYWDYASLSDAELKQVKAALPLLQKSVLHTATSFEFHFGYLNGHWRLLFTKLIYPCSA